MQDQTDLSIRKEIEVDCPQGKAFAFFVEQIGSWWPLDTKSIGASKAMTAVIETEVGGRWFERGEDGVECDWGQVLAYDPPSRLALSWQIGADFQFDPDLDTRLDFEFSSIDEFKTRLVLTHSGLEGFGPAAQQMLGIFESPRGWGEVLDRFARASEG